MKCKVIAISNQKGGVGKTTTAANLGVGLARKGKRVLLIDADHQGNLSHCFGIMNPDDIDYSFAEILENVINNEEFDVTEGIVRLPEGVDFVPGNVQLSSLELSLVNVMGRELVVRDYISMIRDRYDYIIIDCTPSLGMMTINALVAADSVIVPIDAGFLSAKGLEHLIKIIGTIQRKMNPNLKIEGILLTKVDMRTNYAKEVIKTLKDGYEKNIHFFNDFIPSAVKTAEAQAVGESIFVYAPNTNVALAYESLAEEVMENE